jgi:hypothetical protein
LLFPVHMILTWGEDLLQLDMTKTEPGGRVQDRILVASDAMSRCAHCPSPTPTLYHTRPRRAPGRWEARVGVPSGRAVRTTSRHVYLGLFARDTDAAKARCRQRRDQLALQPVHAHMTYLCRSLSACAWLLG